MEAATQSFRVASNPEDLRAQLGFGDGLVPDIPDDADYRHHDTQRCDSDYSQAVLPLAVAFHHKPPQQQV
jgi:hypothetical protein